MRIEIDIPDELKQRILRTKERWAEQHGFDERLETTVEALLHLGVQRAETDEDARFLVPLGSTSWHKP